jgi:ribulose-bisphosphate carboxylase large chain
VLEYINTKYKPGKDELVAEFSLEPNKISLEQAAEHIAAESSIGTWTDVSTLSKDIAKKLSPKVFYLDKSAGIIKIAYSSELFELGNMPEILSSIAGNIFGMSAVNSLRLEDIEFPKRMIASFKGPKYGIEGIRRLLKVKERPLTGTIIKPKVGLDAEHHAQVAHEAWMGGIDIVKDDENLTSQKFNPFHERVKRTLEKLHKAEDRTGEKKVYMPNVTAETNEMLKRAEFVQEHGGTYVMVDILTCGWSGLQTLRDQNFDLVIHAHRAGHAALTRNKKHGISMLTLAKICRLIGTDQLHIGAIVGKMEGSSVEVEVIGEEIEQNLVHEKKQAHVLEQSWYGIKPVFAVCSGGLHPGKVQDLMHYMGNNIIIQAGGGVHGHPFGTTKGAMAMRQAVDAVMQKTDLRVYAKSHSELAKAIEKWGM